jgi:hypothetical protein
MEIRYEGDQFVAVRDGVVVAASKNKDYLKRKVAAMAEALPSLQKAAVEEFAINDRFTFTDQLVKMVAKGQTASCVITGEGGLGKSYTVMKALRDAGLKDISEMPIGEVIPPRGCFRVVKGFSTAKGLYRILFENQNSIIVFDDCDSILKDPDALNLLKGALDSYDKRYITWNTSINDDGLPRSFEFKGGVVFVSNMAADKISQAIRSRAMNVDLSMTTDQKIERMETIMRSDEFMYDVPMPFKIESLELIRKNKDTASEISLRTLINVTKIRNSGNSNWESLAKYMLVN